ncbi:hypothetical protein [Halorubrum vacuolatum]|uniref:Uncharacterized protein n=1 Tax=Halorubrum vacuolatum TaxID=63740 RepID=A0A238XGF8_HALVU|nr:hypothetical protein [Halorubrum vacuolatum]SNR57583.1 hypothetical protein SAMN06264855_11730 [Halorubrum vacuolatum]
MPFASGPKLVVDRLTPLFRRKYFDGKEAVLFTYDEDDNEIALIPLDQYFDRDFVTKIDNEDNSAVIAASGFFKDRGMMPEQTIRYRPEWDESLGGDNVDGGLRIDLDQEPEFPSS